MRLRVVPGFISPPPGFGGLGYTPTARACVNISIPLQLRVIDMLDVFTPLLKLFANEPLERLMYTIIIFGLTLWLIPKEFTVAFNAYTEIPWLFQIIVFAFRGRHFLLKIASTYSKALFITTRATSIASFI